MRGMELSDALSLAADFVVRCIDATSTAEDARWYGAKFESQIPWLCGQLTERR